MKQRSWLAILLSFAGPCRGKLVLSVICAIISVAGGFVRFGGARGGGAGGRSPGGKAAAADEVR